MLSAIPVRFASAGPVQSPQPWTFRPDVATHALHLGLPDFNSFLTVYATLSDHDGAPENLDINGGGIGLSVGNTFTGTVTVTNASLVINNANALGSASGTDADGTIINANGSLTLGIGMTLVNEKITLNPGGTLSGMSGTSTYANPITINGGTLLRGTYNGTLSGSGDFAVNGATLAGTANYTGNLTFTGTSIVATASALVRIAILPLPPVALPLCILSRCRCWSRVDR